MKILVTGHSGFVGKNLIPKLKTLDHDIYTPTYVSYWGLKRIDLRNMQDASRMISKIKPDIVIHLAATVGGIGANKVNPGKFIYENLTMGINVIHACKLYNVKQIIMVGTVCAYPKFTPVPFSEKHIWNGYPEETNAPYGIAKRALMQMVMSYSQQYDINGINLIPTNMYGPFDSFTPHSSHVIPALILKIATAKRNNDNSITVWGTGKASREFLYVTDFCDAVIKTVNSQSYISSTPINIGTGQEITIHNLTILLCNLMNYHGEIIFDSTKPDGQPRRYLDVKRAKNILQFEAHTVLRQGLYETIKWYYDNK